MTQPRGAGETPRFGSRITICFLLSALASIGLTVVYGLGGQPQVEGTLIFVSFGGIAIGFVLGRTL